ncbi:MAG TPA: DsbA family protein [Aestuariivirgaceae bacterium]|jgi:protein-disulfide isomerase|nr:DsbA family protein [Aestuariivirgaceae bacterium]
MTVNRRQLLILGGSAVVTAGIAAWLFASSRLTDGFTAVPSAKAATPDLTTLLEPPALGDKILGKSDAPVTIVEYASATCPHCAAFHKDVFPQLKSEFIDTGKVKFIFREFPFDDLALAAFMLARCAPPEKYFPMLDVLFEQQQVWASKEARVELGKIAQLAGIGEDGFDKCLKNEDLAKGIMAIRDKAANTYGVEATPTFFVNGKLIRGEHSIDQFRKFISEAAS